MLAEDPVRRALHLLRAVDLPDGPHEEAGVIECAATYAFHPTNAHAFVDGNKRVGAAAMLVFLAANDVDLPATEDELYDLFLSIASSASTRSDVEDWLRTRRPR